MATTTEYKREWHKRRFASDETYREKIRERKRDYMARKRDAERLQGKEGARMRRWRYGLTDVQFSERLEAQAYRCAVCPQELASSYNTCVDHDHTTGAIRGLLCRKCNLALGHLDDDLARVLALAEYLASQGGDPIGSPE